MGVSSEVPVIFPSSGSVARPPLSSTGSIGLSSPASQVVWVTPTSCRPSRWASLPRPLIPPRCTEATGSPRFLGSPCTCMPCSSTPVGPRRQACYGASVLPSAIAKASAPTSDFSLSGLNHTAYMLVVYASRRQLPDAAQDSLPAGGQPWLGRNLTCWAPSVGFSFVALHGVLLLQACPGAPRSRKGVAQRRQGAKGQGGSSSRPLASRVIPSLMRAAPKLTKRPKRSPARRT